MSRGNRNDITVAVLLDGRMYIAQGNPAREVLDGIGLVCDEESGLYHSQLAFRGAWARKTGQFAVGTRTTFRLDKGAVGAFVPFGDLRNRTATGRPCLVDKVA